jgi:hypothetical protein
MSRYLLVFFVAATLSFACNRSGKKASQFRLDEVKKDMTEKQVWDIAGQPTVREDLGMAVDENNDTTHYVKWHYGGNESVTFLNGKVNDVDTDVKATNERLQHIMDSAKAAAGK